MKILVLYDSYFTNTYQLAESLACSFESSGAIVSLERIYQIDFSSVGEFDLLVIGAPTHNQGMPRPVKSVLKRLPNDLLCGQQVLTFDTRYKMPARKSGSAAKQMMKLLEKLGGQALLLPESFYVQERRGPLYPGEMERVRAWAVSLLSNLVEPA
jgi:menaquinone-dependent protoporphyrinogen IX oxidase